MLISVVYMLIVSVCQAGMAGCAKFSLQEASIFQLIFIQNLVGLVISIPQLLVQGDFPKMKTKKWGLHLTRGISGVVRNLTFFGILPFGPLVIAVMLSSTGPMMIPLVLWVWAKRKVPLKLWLASVLGFVGVIVILQPGMGYVNPIMLVGLVASLALAVTYIAIRFMRHTEPPSVIGFMYFAFSVVVFCPFAIWQWKAVDGWTYLALIGGGILFYGAQILAPMAFRTGKAAVLSSLTYLAIIWSGILDWAFWNKVPNWLTVVGAIIVILAGILCIFFERQNLARLHKHSKSH